MKRNFLLISFLLLFATIQAQITDVEKNIRAKPVIDTVKGWKAGGFIALNLAQTSLKNWSAGGNNSIAANGLISLFANRKSEKDLWENNLDVGYGMLQQTDQHNNKQIVKTDDNLSFNSKYGREITKNLFYATFLSFRTQMAPGYNNPTAVDRVKISNLLAPAYVILAVGMDYKPGNHFEMFVAPLTGRLTIVRDTALSNHGAFGVSAGKHELAEFRGYIRLTYKKDIMQNVTFQAKADFFSNYLKNPQNIVVNTEYLLSMKVNKYIAATLGMTLMYDDAIKINDPTLSDPNHAIGPRIQFKEILGIGFSYKFKS